MKTCTFSRGDNTNIKSRNLTIDFIRGVSIILVVFGHNIQYGSGLIFYESEGYFDNVLFKLIYSFHMPLFALLSGYLFFWSINKPLKEVLKKGSLLLSFLFLAGFLLKWQADVY